MKEELKKEGTNVRELGRDVFRHYTYRVYVEYFFVKDYYLYSVPVVVVGVRM